MKKLICLVMTMFILAGSSFAQDKMDKKDPAAKEHKMHEKKGGKMKKDGTPDMRHKGNKDMKKKPMKHMKKDGTPDMRHKENRKMDEKK